MTSPMLAIWDGEGFQISLRHAKECAARFVIGDKYMLSVDEPRSERSHRFFFASVAEAWKNLPEELAERFPTPKHLRKAALIQGGFYTETIIDCETAATALRVAAYARHKDDFSHIVTRGPFVVERIAQSQSKRAMGAKDFETSKRAVLEIVSAMIGVIPDALTREAGQAA